MSDTPNTMAVFANIDSKPGFVTGQLEEEGLELCRRATALRGHADRILQERRDQRAANQRANRTI
jgi:hypothetical protein